MTSQDLQYPTSSSVPGSGVLVEGPFTFLGHKINELNPQAAEKEMRDLIGSQKDVEALFIKVIEQTGKYLVLVNSGGITVCLGVVTALVSSGQPVLQVLPGALMFVLGLGACGLGIISVGLRMEGEVRKSLDDLLRVTHNEMTTPWLVWKTQHRRKILDEKTSAPYFLWSFLLFIGGAFSVLLGLTWPELIDLWRSFFSGI